MAHTPVPVLRLPDIHPLIDADYTPYDVGVMGEFDVRDRDGAVRWQADSGRRLPLQWNGGIYYAAQKRSAITDEAKRSTASIGLLYYSRWKSQNSALSFLRVYAGELPRKYSGLSERKKDETDATEQVYSTSEGDVLLSLSDNGVFIERRFPAGTRAQAARQDCKCAVGCAIADDLCGSAKDGRARTCDGRSFIRSRSGVGENYCRCGHRESRHRRGERRERTIYFT